MRPFSFEEYARCWRDNPKQMEKYTLTLQDFAENAIRETADRLHQEGRRATARQLMQYGEKLKFVSRHPSEFQSEEAKKQWASDIGALEGFGSFVRRNNLRIQMPSVEDDAEKEQQKINRFAQQQQQNQNKEYRGMVDLVEMLFDAMEKAFSIDRRRTLGTDLKEEGTLYQQQSRMQKKAAQFSSEPESDFNMGIDQQSELDTAKQVAEFNHLCKRNETLRTMGPELLKAAAKILVAAAIRKNCESNFLPLPAMTPEQLDRCAEQVMSQKLFQEVAQEFGDLNSVQNAAILQEKINETDGMYLYQQYLDTGRKSKQREEKQQQILDAANKSMEKQDNLQMHNRKEFVL